MSIDGRVHDLLGVPAAAEKDLDTVLRESYAARPERDPDPRMDIDYVLISRALEWGVTAAAGGVVGNAVYDGAKAALRGFMKRRRFRPRALLSAEEAGAFALYALAHVVRHQVFSTTMWVGSDKPPEMVAIDRQGNDWVCRFERSRQTEWHGKRAAWVEIVDVRVDGRAPDIARTCCRASTDLRLLPPGPGGQATTAANRLALYRDPGLEDRGLGERQACDWTPIGRR